MNENVNEILAEAAMNPDMVVPAELAQQVTSGVANVEILSTNIVDHLLAKAVICPADVSSHGLTKKFWQDICEFFGCVYISRLKDNAKIVLVTPKDNSPKFERATKAGMNTVEYKTAVADLMASEDEAIKGFLASNAEWQKMLANEADKEAKAKAKAEAKAEREAKAKAEEEAKAVNSAEDTSAVEAEATEANENVV